MALLAEQHKRVDDLSSARPEQAACGIDAVCTYSHRTAMKHLGILRFAPVTIWTRKSMNYCLSCEYTKMRKRKGNSELGILKSCVRILIFRGIPENCQTGSRILNIHSCPAASQPQCLETFLLRQRCLTMWYHHKRPKKKFELPRYSWNCVTISHGKALWQGRKALRL